jgi:hypothetical protein
MSGIASTVSVGIKSIQRGTISITTSTGTGSNTATITSVDTTKSEIQLLGGSGATTGTYSGFLRIELTNATTVTAYYVGGTVGATIAIGYQVVEHY